MTRDLDLVYDITPGNIRPLLEMPAPLDAISRQPAGRRVGASTVLDGR